MVKAEWRGHSECEWRQERAKTGFQSEVSIEEEEEMERQLRSDQWQIGKPKRVTDKGVVNMASRGDK